MSPLQGLKKEIPILWTLDPEHPVYPVQKGNFYTIKVTVKHPSFLSFSFFYLLQEDLCSVPGEGCAKERKVSRICYPTPIRCGKKVMI